jgi:hypothetical protein
MGPSVRSNMTSGAANTKSCLSHLIGTTMDCAIYTRIELPYLMSEN